MKKKSYIANYYYSIGDTVIHKSALNTIEAEITGINYTMPQIICKEKVIDNIQIIWFESAPLHFHNAFEFLPHGETLIKLNKQLDTMEKKLIKKVNKKFKNKVKTIIYNFRKDIK